MGRFALVTIVSLVLLTGGTTMAQQACSGSSECDDGNLCTIDSCTANVCVRTPDATACGAAEDFPLGAKKMKFRIPPSNPDARGVKLLATEGVLNLGNLPVSLSDDDPVIKGGSLRIFSAAGGFDHTYPLPFAHWDYFPFNSAVDYQGYQYKDNHNEASAIGIVKILAGSKAKLKGKGQSGGPAMEFGLSVNPDPVSMILSLGNKRYCFQFGVSATPPSFRSNYVVDKIFWAKNAPGLSAPPACPCAVDSDCDDGAACSGTETCVGGFCQPGGGTCP
jgi:hypothetical protein